MIDDEEAYALLRSRDQRFDGRIFVAVVTTGIYCRPSCPAVMPKPENVRFFATSAAAQEAGFRICKRCRPDATPGSPEWNVRADLVGRAMRLIADGVADREGVAGLAARLGYSERQVHRQLVAELGAGPQALARAQRAQTARSLLETTALPVSDVAFAAGFASLRQFNATIRKMYGTSPTGVRTSIGGRTHDSTAGRAHGATPGTIALRLAYRPPLDATALFGFLAERAVAGIEDGDRGFYRRSLDLPHGAAVVTLRAVADAGHVSCELRLEDLRDLAAAVQRCRRLLDLDADPCEIDGLLAEDPLLAPLVTARPGRRIPGHVDMAELAIRALLDQRLGVEAARALAGRLARWYGRPLAEPLGTVTHTCPRMDVLAAVDPAELPMPPDLGRTLADLAGRLAAGTIGLDAGADRDEAERQLLAVDGIGPWTAGYVRMRALGDPDVFLPADPGVRHALIRLGHPGAPDAARKTARRWRPWRSYAVQHLWAACGE